MKVANIFISFNFGFFKPV